MALLRRRRSRTDKSKKLKRREAYRQVATLLGGELHEGKRASGDRVLVEHGPWHVWLDTYTVSTGQTSVTYTRVRAHFRGRRDLRVTVRRRTWIDRLVARCGFGRALRGDPRLTDRYVVKGRPEPRVSSLLAVSGLTDTILSVSSLRLEVKRASRKLRKRHGEDTGQVVCQTTGVITDVQRLAGMIRAVGETLEALERLGESNREEIVDL